MTGFEASLARRAQGLLAVFNVAGILSAADVHVATRLAAAAGERDEAVLLAAALVVRSTRHGSVVLDLSTARHTTSPDVDGVGDGGGPDSDRGGVDDGPAAAVDLPWPGADWVVRCAASPLVGGPLRMLGPRLWLGRYWDQEQQVADELLGRSVIRPGDLDLGLLAAGLHRLFGVGDDDQRLAAAVCALSRVSVLAGGPGTGKTTTVARVLALLREQQPGWRVALAAPTGKAAARLEEAVRSSSATLPAPDRHRLGDVRATTLHRLLGWRPGARSRFRHDRDNHLALEVVVVDESSMVSLTMMARLLDALRPTTRLVLVGDPDQLASVEAGAVLGDLVDPASRHRRTPEMAADLRTVLGVAGAGAGAGSAEAVPVTGQPRTAAAGLRDGVAWLSTTRRFAASGAIGQLAAAVQQGRVDDALALLRSGSPDLELVELEDGARPTADVLATVRADVRAAGRALHEAAGSGDGAGALEALDRHRLLCAHRSGPRGVRYWGGLAARWVAEDHAVQPRPDGRYPGEALLVTTNDYDVGLYNGDTGVVVDDGDGALVAVFGRGGAPIPVPLGRLGAVRSLHAMTVHRSQGSQFARVTVVLPLADSPLGTRETLYTAATRATTYVRVIGSAQAFAAAVGRPAARATGLRERLQGP